MYQMNILKLWRTKMLSSLFVVVPLLGFTTMAYCGEISKLNVEGVQFSLSFDGDGSLPPVNKLIKLRVAQIPVEGQNTSAGLKTEQSSYVDAAAEGGEDGIKEATTGEKDASNVKKQSQLLKSTTENQVVWRLTMFDAQMPEHKHGMFVKPVIKGINALEYVVYGVKLHMKGLWELSFEFTDGEKIVSKKIQIHI